MLEKPKFLTGEVKEFIDTIFVCVKSSGYGETFDIDRWFNINEYELKPFYNQPFETAMIEKYFKYMQDITSGGSIGNPHIIYKNGTYHLWFTPYRAVIERDNPSETHKTMLPRTLNHFISDCKRAGIGLEWRE